jgi:hypothetical protein
MSTRRVTEEHAREIILSMCRQFIDDEPARGESLLDVERRTTQLEWDLTASIGASIRPDSLEDLLATLGEIQSVECGTHPELDQNAALTINTAPDLTDRLNERLRQDLYLVLQLAAFRPAKEASVAA